jgi:Mn-dependent DtxR family transcriptional regulator
LVSVRLHAALTEADGPVRARSLAYDLGLSASEVTAELRRLQDLGVATSHDRRWTLAAAPAAKPGGGGTARRSA